MVILRIHGKGTDNFSLAMLLIYAYVPLIFLLPPSSSPGFVMIFFSIDELSGSTVLSLIMCLNLMHHTNYLAQQSGYTCCLLFDVAAPADFLNIDRNHTFSLSFVCLINYCHQCACLETTPKALKPPPYAIERKVRGRFLKGTFSQVLRKQFGPFSVARKRKLKNRRSTVSFGKPRIQAQAMKQACFAKPHTHLLRFFPLNNCTRSLFYLFFKKKGSSLFLFSEREMRINQFYVKKRERNENLNRGSQPCSLGTGFAGRPSVALLPLHRPCSDAR